MVQAEAAKRQNERHPIVKWHDHLVELQRDQQRDTKTGLVSAVRDGVLSALLALSYDLYVLRNYSKLQDEVVARLRHRDQFQGARYELFVAATFIRAGCDIAYEDESDGSKKHTEFAAKHQESGFEMSVEAKARHMRGDFDMATIRPGVRDLLLNAAEKGAAHPLVVFVELNLPLNAEPVKALVFCNRHYDCDGLGLSADRDRLTLRLFEDLIQARSGFRLLDRPHDVPTAAWRRFGRSEMGARLSLSRNGFRSRLSVPCVGLWRGLRVRRRFGLAIPTLAANSFTPMARTTLPSAT